MDFNKKRRVVVKNSYRSDYFLWLPIHFILCITILHKGEGLNPSANFFNRKLISRNITYLQNYDLIKIESENFFILIRLQD